MVLGLLHFHWLVLPKIERDDRNARMETSRIVTGGIEATKNVLSEYPDLVKGVAARVTAFHMELHVALDISAMEEPNYYHAYPFLFRDEFPTVSDADASTIAVAGVFYLNHLCLLDDVVDSEVARQPYKLFMSALLHEEAIIQLGTLFPSSSPFWAALSSYHREFAAAMLREQTEHTGRLCAFTEAEVYQIAKGKAALSKMTTAALALLDGRPEAIAKLSASQDCFNAARQMYDDVKDWKEDYLNYRYSSLLTAALLDHAGREGLPLQGSGDWHSSLSVEALSARLHYGGHIDQALAQAAQWCNDAIEHAAGCQVGGWNRLIQSLRTQVLRLRGDLAMIRARATTGQQQPLPVRAADEFPGEAKSG